MDHEADRLLGEYVVIKAEENGVNVIGLTRGRDTNSITQKNLIRVRFY